MASLGPALGPSVFTGQSGYTLTKQPLPEWDQSLTLSRTWDVVQRLLGPFQPSNSVLVPADVCHQIESELMHGNFRGVRRCLLDQWCKPLNKSSQQILLERENFLFSQSLQCFTSASKPQP
jgi:hypothetical protein